MSAARPDSKRRPEARVGRPAKVPKRIGPAWLADAALLGVPALAAGYVHFAALGAFYSPDDLILLERVRGIAAFPETIWRVLSGRVFWVGMFPLFGPDPLAWHALSLALHVAATFLVGLFARRLGASRATTFLTALLFGATARARTVVWQVTGTGEILALLAALAVALILLASRSWRARSAAGLVHAIGLLCKETIGLAPLALVFARTGAGERRVSGRALVLPLALTVALGLLLAMNRSGTGSLGGEAYALGFGRHILDHLLTYTLWSTDLVHLFAGFGSPLPWAWAIGAGVLLSGMVVFAWRSGSSLARVGLAWWFLLLLPVLALRSAEYEHYVYAARAGWSLAFASLLLAAVRGLEPRGNGAPTDRGIAWITVILVGSLHVVTAAMYLTAMHAVRIPETGLLRDTFLRKMEVARNAAVGLERGLLTTPTRLVVYAAPGEAVLFSVRSGRATAASATDEPRYTLIDAVFDDGRGVRALFPFLTDVRFSEHVAARDTAAQIAVNAAGGQVVVCGVGPEGHAAAAAFWSERGLTQAARTHLDEALQLYPAEPLLLAARDALADTLP